MRLKNICTRTFKHHYGGSITSLDLYLEMGPPMLENRVKESQSSVASPHLPRLEEVGVTYMHSIFFFSK